MRYLALLGVLGLVSCSGTEDVVKIRQYHLRAVTGDTGGVDSLRAEQLKRLYGAISAKEMRDRLGHYYTIRWDGPPDSVGEPVRIVFEFQQAATGSEIRRLEAEAPPGRKGMVELKITGPQYLQGGRVLAWRLSFFRGERLVQTRQSYLWE